VPIKLSDEQLNTLADIFISTLPADATHGTAEIFSTDGYREYPVTYRSDTGEEVPELFNGWDTPEALASEKLTKYLSDSVAIIGDNFDKTDADYWNHFIFFLDPDHSYYAKFTYIPELDKNYEEEFRKSIGDELYELYERERKNKKISNLESASRSDSDSVSVKEEYNMTKNELLSFIFDEIKVDLPEGWKEVKIKSDIGIEGEKKLINVNYEYIDSKSDRVQFETSNVFGPMNAIIEIHKLMSGDDEWTNAEINLFPDGRINLVTK